MKLEQIPVTGNEKKDDLTEPLKALSEFYNAINHRDLEDGEKLGP